MGLNFTQTDAALNGVTGDTTSPGFDYEKRSQITVIFSCADHVSGNGVFSIDVSNDGVNWATGIAIHDATQVAAGTNVTSVTVNANSSKAYIVPAGFKYYRAVVDETTDGTYSAVFEAAG